MISDENMKSCVSAARYHDWNMHQIIKDNRMRKKIAVNDRLSVSHKLTVSYKLKAFEFYKCVVNVCSKQMRKIF